MKPNLKYIPENLISQKDSVQSRHCPECDSQVSPNADSCPKCNRSLYADGLPAPKAGAIGYLWGGLAGGGALIIVKIIEAIGGFSSPWLERAVFGVVAVLVWNTKKAKLMERRDLGVWKN